MTNHYNSASRLLGLIDAMLAKGDNMLTLSCWAEIFGVADSRSHTLAYLVSERLVVVHQEIDLMERLLVENGSLGPDLYAEPIMFARQSFSPFMLSTANNQTKAWLRDSVRTPFRYMVPSLLSDSHEFESADLLELNKLIAALQEVITSSTLPPPLLQIVRDHIALLLRAMANYPIQGPRALSEALRQMAVEIYLNREVLNENIDLPEVGLLQRTVSKVRGMVEAVNASNDLVTSACLLWETGTKALGALGITNISN